MRAAASMARSARSGNKAKEAERFDDFMRRRISDRGQNTSGNGWRFMRLEWRACVGAVANQRPELFKVVIQRE